MRPAYLAFTFSLCMKYFSFVLLIPVVVALLYKETNSVLPFVAASLSAILISFVIKKTKNHWGNYTLTWIVGGLFLHLQ